MMMHYDMSTTSSVLHTYWSYHSMPLKLHNIVYWVPMPLALLQLYQSNVGCNAMEETNDFRNMVPGM